MNVGKGASQNLQRSESAEPCQIAAVVWSIAVSAIAPKDFAVWLRRMNVPLGALPRKPAAPQTAESCQMVAVVWSIAAPVANH